MPNTFTWRNQATPVGTDTAAVKTAQFGDGYSQTAQDGINNISSNWPITYSGMKADVLAARDFLRAQAGASFYWTPPGDVQGLYRCTTWTIQPQGGSVYTLSATFQQVFSP
jgi:phage-related protein